MIEPIQQAAFDEDKEALGDVASPADSVALSIGRLGTGEITDLSLPVAMRSPDNSFAISTLALAAALDALPEDTVLWMYGNGHSTQHEDMNRAEDQPILFALRGRLMIDQDAQRVSIDGQEAEFTSVEYKLLGYLVRNVDRTISRAELYDKVWGWRFPRESKVLDVYIGYLRQKLGDELKPHLVTVRGHGYRFDTELPEPKE